jgi:flagellar protein FlgJ
MNFAIATTGTPSVSALAATPAPASTEHRKLTAAAQQFEGMLLQEMLKPMKEHGFCQEDRDDDSADKDSGSGFADTLSSYGTEALATAIAKGGGMGIAKRVVAQVESERDSHNKVVATEK